jgi:hypothetical protein
LQAAGESARSGPCPSCDARSSYDLNWSLIRPIASVGGRVRSNASHSAVLVEDAVVTPNRFLIRLTRSASARLGS